MLLKKMGVHRHHRSASMEMDLVMDFSQSGGGTIDQLPLPHIHRPPDQETIVSQLASQNLPTRQRSGTNTTFNPKTTMVFDHSEQLHDIVEPKGNHVKRDGTPPIGDQPIQMSLVSPPFTPSDSRTDLVHKLDSPEPISLPSKEATAQVRSNLDDILPSVFCESRARIPTTNGEEIFLHVYRNNVDSKEHLAIVFGQDIHSRTLFAPREGETEHDRMTRGAYTGKLYPGRQTSGPDSELPELQDIAGTKSANNKNQDVLCRIHSECYTGETAWSARCDCGEQLDEAARLMSEAGRGVIVYLRQEGRGIGLGEKLKAYNLQDLGADTVQANLLLRHPADGRSFGLATAILLDLGLDHIRLMTNNPDKIVAVEGKNKEITVTQRVPMIPLSWQKKGGFQSAEVDKYLATKIERMGHLLNR